MPHLFAGRRGYVLAVELSLDGLCAAPIGGELGYPLHHPPLWLVDHERVARLVVPKTVRWLHRRDDLALASFLEFSSPASLGEGRRARERSGPYPVPAPGRRCQQPRDPVHGAHRKD